MSTNYVVAINIGVRRLTDTSRDVHSLCRLLDDILHHPGAINRRSNRALYRGLPREMADRSFDSLVGPKSWALPQRVIEADLRTIKSASARVRRFTNKRIAHRTPKKTIRRLPTFQELDDGLDCLNTVLCKYNTLITAAGMSTTEATRQYYWQEVLFLPWIPVGNPLRSPD